MNRASDTLAAWVLVLACGGAAVLPGCQSGDGGGAGADAASAGGAGQKAVAAKGGGGGADAISSSQLRERALTLLGEMAQSPQAEERYNAIEAMLPVTSRLETAVRRGLTDPDDRVRVVSAMAAGKARLSRVVEFLRPLTKDNSEMVQAAAIFALLRCGAPADQQPLAALLQHPRPLVRAHAAYIIGELGNPSALAMIREAARDPLTRADPAQTRVYRLQLAEAMIKLGDDRAVHEVRAALYPSRPEELEATALAAQILGQVKDQASTAQLMHLTTMSDPRAGRMPAEIRLAAATSLAKLGHTEGSFIADECRADRSPGVRAQSALLYGETGRRANLPVLQQLLEDPEPMVRIAAAAGVLKITDGPTGGRTAAVGN